MRGTALAAAAMAGVLTLAGCAKDSGGGNSSNNTAASTGGSDCVTAQKPPAAPAAASSSTAAGEKVDGSKLKIGLAFDVGGRGDASFNDAAAAGTDKAKSDLGVTTVSESTASASEAESAKQQRLDQMASSGLNPIIAVGFAYAPSVKVVAAKYPNTKFAIVDDDSITLPNVTPLVFAEEQGSFLAGVAAAYKSKNCHIGFVGGVNTPLIQKFEAGFLQGAKTVSSKIKIEDEYLTPAGDFSGFQDPPKGNAKAAAEIAKGADVIYHAAGASGKGVFDAAKAGNALAIGVDSDQYNQKTVEADKDVIITSMLKRVDVAVFDYVQAVAKGDLSGLPKRFDLKVDGVGYATSGGKVDDIKDVLDGYKAQIISGAITVSDKPQK
ncbi:MULTISPECIES: BMP family ABC transporter substrate-binding protein [unclassified Amycolatopsis]|uniref:BMP family lipoprotein n=1 Tax=unclassified Amycolatopsis TaxID=2618356 RepID=UPI002874DCD0|nr:MULTISPECIES: BMP family ABC transporter substrate-binding protein [unclassified Amycolatopsis]MDS0135279.1 BMP family ABC transporter substrate-binding protein [Amycolatopsis sp. 505]MDS0142944.1 BMP family ABC transporter substrate-binding protein [Amycolatopsis sp. CM201R]